MRREGHLIGTWQQVSFLYCTVRRRCRLTKPADHLSLQHELIAETRRNKPLWTSIRRTPYPIPHMTTRKHQDRNDARDTPERSGSEERRKVLVAEETHGDGECNDHWCDDVRDWVEWFVDFVGVRSERANPVVQVDEFKSAAEMGTCQ